MRSQRLEVRAGTVTKAGAIAWVRQQLPGVRCFLSMEDMPNDRGDDVVLSDTDMAILTALCEARSARARTR